MNVRSLNVSFQEDADGHFDDILCAVRVALHLIQANVVFAVAGISKFRHCDVFDVFLFAIENCV